MFNFGRKKEPEIEELPQLSPVKKIQRRPKKEIPVVWGRKERMFVGVILVTTVILSAVFAISTSSFQIKIPTFEKINVSLPRVDTSGTIVLTKEKSGTANYKEIEKELVNEVEGKNSFYGMWAIDLQTNQGFGFNEHEQIEGASLFKLPLMIAVFKEIDKGNITLDDLVQGSTYEDLMTRMGKHSDNNAFLAVLGAIGTDKMNAAIKEIGMKDTSFDDSLTTPYDVALLFQKLMKGELIAESSKNKMLEFMTDTDYEDYIAAGVPENIKVSHKYGREAGVLNDAGVVDAPHPFVIAFMTRDADEFEVTETIPQLTKIVYNGLNE